MAKTREQLMDEMLDREAIRDLPNRYCHYVWSKNLEGILSLFTEDGLFSTEGNGPAQEIKGQKDLRKFYEGAMKGGAAPFIHNITITLKNDKEATGACYLKVHNRNEQMKLMGIGYYEDEYAKENGQWKFRARRFKMVQSAPPEGSARS